MKRFLNFLAQPFIFIFRLISVAVVALVSICYMAIVWKPKTYEKEGSRFCHKKIVDLDMQQFKHCSEDEISKILAAYPVSRSELELGASSSEWKFIDVISASILKKIAAAVALSTMMAMG